MRRRIVGAARIEFCERGYAGATLEQISQRAGISRAAVHHHFGSKDLLYRAVMAQTEARIVAAVGETRCPPDGGTLLTELSVLFSNFLALQVRHPSTAASMMCSVLDAHRHQQFLTPEHVAVARNRLTAVVHGAVARGELSADTDVASLVRRWPPSSMG